MRRKCFLVFLIAVCAAFFLDYVDFDILSREKQLDYENSKEYIVRVEKIAEKVYSKADSADGEYFRICEKTAGTTGAADFDCKVAFC